MASVENEIRVLIIHNAGDSSLPSGELNVVNAEANMLKKMGYDVHVDITSNDQARGIKGIIKAGLLLYWSPVAYQHMSKLIDAFSPDIVHFHSVLPLLTVSAFQACKDKDIPVVQTLHNYRWVCVEGGLFRDDHYCQACITGSRWNGIRYRCSRNSTLISGSLTLNNQLHVKSNRLFDLVDLFLPVSSFVRDKHIEAGFPPDKLIVKSNGIDLDAIEHHNSTRREGLLFVGRLSKAKGSDILKEIIIRMSNASINVLGDGPALADLKHFVQERNAIHVQIHGKVNATEVYKSMMQSACIVMPSLFAETFGLVAIEAMACSTPIIGAKSGGLTGLIEASGAGTVIDPPDDTSAYVDAAQHIVHNPDLVRRYGEAGKQYVHEHLRIEHTTQQLVDIYQSVIDRRKHYA